jgi:lipopolysaccharide transport system ATP-binding protein
MKKREIERKFDEIVAFAEIEKFIDTPVKHYSSGMFVRLAFAVAAHLEPEVLLVDEVLAVGDAAFQRKCLGKMGEVAKTGRTVLFVSHNMAAVRALCKTAVLLDGGCKVSEGEVDGIVRRYLEESISQGCTGELPRSAHALNTGEFWIHELILANQKGEPVAELRLGEVFTVTIRFEVRQPVQWVRIGLGFNTHEGVRIATLHHTDEGHEFFAGEQGFYEISASLVNPFLPGTYIIGVGAHRALGGITIDFVPQALRFLVLDISEGEAVHKQYNDGVIQLGASWAQLRRTGELDEQTKVLRRADHH